MPKVIRIHKAGDASVLRIESIDVHDPSSDEVQIEVKAIGLNRAEVMFRNRAYIQEPVYPTRLGYEAAGVITKLGSSVKEFSVGDAVSIVPALDIAKWGTYGEVINTHSRLVVKHPDGLSYSEAASIWMQYITAWGALVEQAKLSMGDYVLVTAASSSVGIAAIQVARAVGAKVIATTRRVEKRQTLLNEGADHVVVTDDESLVDRVMQITAGKGVLVTFDPIGGPGAVELGKCTMIGGAIILYGALSQEPTPFPLFIVLAKSLTIKGYLYSEIVADDAALTRAKDFIVNGLKSFSLKPRIARTFKFDEIQDAHRYLESNQQIGKVVVTI